MTINNKDHYIPALIFELKKIKLIKAFIRGKRNTSNYWNKGGPLSLKMIPFPKLIAEDWVIIKTVYCGICGSDMTELQLKGSLDNPIRSLISFPQIMGHEVVGIIEKVGSNVHGLMKGDRVVIDPWFSCRARGIKPICLRCSIGDYKHCRNFQKGNLPKGMHLGVTKGYGGFSPYITVHESQCFKIPENVTFEQAVLADPFSVALHVILTLNPKPQSRVLVYGLGIIGLLCILSLKTLFKVNNITAIGRYKFQSDIALKTGAKKVFLNQGEGLIEEIAQFFNTDLYTPNKGLKWSMDGPDYIIDTIGSAESLETGYHIITCQGKLIFLGVSKPKRFENTLHYFKEIEVIGSNAFGIEKFQGSIKHAFHFYLQFLKDKMIDTAAFITHTFPLVEYQSAFTVLANKREYSAIKVIFRFDNYEIV